MIDLIRGQADIKTAIAHMLCMFKKVDENMNTVREMKDILKDTNGIFRGKNTIFEMKNTLN